VRSDLVLPVFAPSSETLVNSIGTNLLLLHGHIHDLELVRRLANMPSTSPPRRSGGKRQKQGSESTPYAAIRSIRATFLPKAR